MGMGLGITDLATRGGGGSAGPPTLKQTLLCTGAPSTTFTDLAATGSTFASNTAAGTQDASAATADTMMVKGGGVDPGSAQVLQEWAKDAYGAGGTISFVRVRQKAKYTTAGGGPGTARIQPSANGIARLEIGRAACRERV